MNIMKKVIANIIQTLTHICSISFQEGSFSHNMKIPEVMLILKSGDKDILGNY